MQISGNIVDVQMILLLRYDYEELLYRRARKMLTRPTDSWREN